MDLIRLGSKNANVSSGSGDAATEAKNCTQVDAKHGDVVTSKRCCVTQSQTALTATRVRMHNSVTIGKARWAVRRGATSVRHTLGMESASLEQKAVKGRVSARTGTLGGPPGQSCQRWTGVTATVTKKGVWKSERSTTCLSPMPRKSRLGKSGC